MLQQTTANSWTTQLRDYHLYVLLCEGGRRYVGISGDLINRIEAHFTGNGSQFTKKYPPAKVLSHGYIGTMTYTEANKIEAAEVNRLIAELGRNLVCGGGKSRS